MLLIFFNLGATFLVNVKRRLCLSSAPPGGVLGAFRGQES